MMSYLISELKPARSYAFLFIACVCSMLTTGCGAEDTTGGSGDEHTEGQPIGVNFKLKVEGPDDVVFQDYIIGITWYGELLSASNDAGQGESDPFYITKEYEGKTDTSGDFIESELVPNKRRGKWLFRASADGWSAECERTLPEDAEYTPNINFTKGKPGCEDGSAFP